MFSYNLAHHSITHAAVAQLDRVLRFERSGRGFESLQPHHIKVSYMTMDTVSVRDICLADASSVADIYNHYVLNTVVSFEEAAVSTEAMAIRFTETLDAKLPWLIAERNGVVTGFAYASQWKSRCAYRNSLETTIYLDSQTVGCGIGSRLYSNLLQRVRELGYHTVIGGIALPNPASMALHEKFGYKKIAHFEQVGFKHNRWVDVGYWQLVL